VDLLGNQGIVQGTYETFSNSAASTMAAISWRWTDS